MGQRGVVLASSGGGRIKVEHWQGWCEGYVVVVVQMRRVAVRKIPGGFNLFRQWGSGAGVSGTGTVSTAES